METIYEDENVVIKTTNKGFTKIYIYDVDGMVKKTVTIYRDGEIIVD